MCEWFSSAEPWLAKCAAYVGAILGVCNTVRSIAVDRYRIKIRLIPVLSEIGGVVALDVTNTGRLATTLLSVSFSVAGKKSNLFKVFPCERLQKGRMPKLLGSGETFRFYVAQESFDHPDWKNIRRPVVSLGDGKEKQGDRIPALLRTDPNLWLVKAMGLESL